MSTAADRAAVDFLWGVTLCIVPTDFREGLAVGWGGFRWLGSA